ncbi:hypothetical protein [Glycomyces harbinensis]|uniref:Excreted virulence factor EspC, type VII ESX diderm n=1 Tax=Glycomyces harbinensis TaxID=58114 RepID=A0A1G6Z340_9ACTN|nr:hypothetical protein [Glycomyces harbinensis]SDD97079.1 hypothetical protein SAMN05216270_11029 [Glycomyces harbinensis]
MPGADVFAMDPDEVHKSVEVLFEIEEEVGRRTGEMTAANAEAAGPLKDAGTALGPALEAAGRWWGTDRAGGFTGLVGDTGEYLAVCAEQAVEIDDYSAADFASLADSGRYPGRASGTGG